MKMNYFYMNLILIKYNYIVNTFYKPYLIQYYTLIRNYKLTGTMQVDYFNILFIYIINKKILNK